MHPILKMKLIYCFFFLYEFSSFVSTYSLTSRNQFRIFSVFFDYINDIENFAFDSTHIALLSKQKIAFIINLSTFDVETQFNLSHMNFIGSAEDNKFNISLQYPRGVLSRNSLFFLFEIHDSHQKRMFSFTDTSINSIQLLLKEKGLIFTTGNETEICNFPDLFEFPFEKKTQLLNVTNLGGSPIQLIAFDKSEEDREDLTHNHMSHNSTENLKNSTKNDTFFEVSETNITLKNPKKASVNENSTFSDETTEFHLYLPSRNKLRKIPDSKLIVYIHETIEKAYDGCLSEPDFSNNDLDFELDSRFFLISCKDQLFVFSFDSLEPIQNTSISINHIYYRNTLENLFFSRTSLRIIESDENQLVYGIFSAEAVCFYTFESYKEDFKYFSNRRSLCMKNSVISTKIEDVFMNPHNGFVNLAMRNQTDESVFFPGFHKCVFNMRTSNFVCQICNTFYCPKQCERYQYPGCNFVGEVQKTFFGVLTGMMLFSIVFLCCAHVCKNRQTLCELFFNLFRCLVMIFRSVIDLVKRINFKGMFRRLSIMWSYVKYWSKCGFWKSLSEEGNNCPICLEHIDIRPKTMFACGRHEAHTDCYQHYLANNRENGKSEGCPFRDA